MLHLFSFLFVFTFKHLHSHLGETSGLVAVDADGLGQDHLTKAALTQRFPQGQPEETHRKARYRHYSRKSAGNLPGEATEPQGEGSQQILKRFTL